MAFQKFQRILVTNDDGIDAPGLKVLEQVAVWVVAPRSASMHLCASARMAINVSL